MKSKIIAKNKSHSVHTKKKMDFRVQSALPP